MSLIAITGTPGVGKSGLARFLCSKLKAEHIDLHPLYPVLKIGYDPQRQCYELNPAALSKYVAERKLKSRHKFQVIDSHVSHKLSSKIVDVVVVLTIEDINKLSCRLKRRGYSARKIAENVECEIYHVCEEQAKSGHGRVFTYRVDMPGYRERILSDMKKMFSRLKNTPSPRRGNPRGAERRI